MSMSNLSMIPDVGLDSHEKVDFSETATPVGFSAQLLFSHSLTRLQQQVLEKTRVDMSVVLYFIMSRISFLNVSQVIQSESIGKFSSEPRTSF